MKVEQYKHANQYHIYNGIEDDLQSYDSLVVRVVYNDGHKQTNNIYKIILGCDWDYSTTTTKHVYDFLEKYTNVNFYNVSNKRKHVNDLISLGVIEYDENMR